LDEQSGVIAMATAATTSLLGLVSASILLASVLAGDVTRVALNLMDNQPLVHHWSRCVGSGHAALTLREDWRQHVAMAHRDLGVERVRFHGILDADMSVSFSPNETGFTNIDSVCDFLLEHNMSMVMELGFMPRWLARGRSGATPVNTDGKHSVPDPDGNYSCTHTVKCVPSNSSIFYILENDASGCRAPSDTRSV
jgi:hypothetical protein